MLAAALPSRRLSWHYRSLDERLIAFANAEVYEGSLVTFPGTGTDPVVRHVLGRRARDRRRGRGGRRDHDDRGRPGRRARARARPHHAPTARSASSRSASRTRPGSRRPCAAPWPASTTRSLEFFDEDRPEAFFVKNLERVQGDERDDVVLTIGYGKTPHGRVLHRFGPLNIEGGERRLNVAITRARRSMTVVSSIAAEDLDPARLRARGAVMLRDFLAYAAGGAAPGCRARSRLRHATSARARAAPRRRPLRRHRRPGAAAARPRARRPRGRRARPPTRSTSPSRTRRAAGRLVLAVESDGPQYAAMRTTRDRDRLRAEQLERLGWRHLRVWSTDVFRDPARDVARILEAVGAPEADPR